MLISGASIVIVDEAHELKNDQNQYRRAMDQVTTLRRVALTGYPLQVMRGHTARVQAHTIVRCLCVFLCTRCDVWRSLGTH